MNQIKYLFLSIFLILFLSACNDSDKYNRITNVVSLDSFYQVCLNNVTYILRVTRIDAYKGYMSTKFNQDSKIIPCIPTQDDLELEKTLFKLCLDNVVYYLRAPRIDGYKGYMSPMFNHDSKIVTC